jgi:hypothetical protein
LNRQEAVLARAKLFRDPVFLKAYVEGDITAANAIREICYGLIETDTPGQFQSGKLTAEEQAVTGL